MLNADIQLVIFDMDGLMFDTEHVSFLSWRDAADRHGYEITLDLFKQTIGTNAASTREFYLTHFGLACPIDMIYESRYQIADEYLAVQGVPVKQGLYELLDYLALCQIPRVVATSSSRIRATRLLEMAKVNIYMNGMVCGDEVERSKPDPQIFLKAAALAGCRPDQCLVLEDSEAGVRAAHQAGMIAIMVPDLKKPDEAIKSLLYKECRSLLDVKALLEQII
ncbi:MAG: HAD family phosphatase [Gorillibacterium sp.]|nr:HAD family phosphatase [Gorillibacterium sp.]